MTAIRNLRLKVAAHVNLSNGGTQHLYFDNSKWDVDLIDYRYFEIRLKGVRQVLAIIPFENASSCAPDAEEAYTPIEEAFIPELTQEEWDPSKPLPPYESLDVMPEKKRGNRVERELVKLRREATNL